MTDNTALLLWIEVDSETFTKIIIQSYFMIALYLFCPFITFDWSMKCSKCKWKYLFPIFFSFETIIIIVIMIITTKAFFFANKTKQRKTVRASVDPVSKHHLAINSSKQFHLHNPLGYFTSGQKPTLYNKFFNKFPDSALLQFKLNYSNGML